MKVKFEVEINPPKWIGPRTRRLLPMLLLLLVLAVPLVAYATDVFSDVPTRARYHDAVDALFNARITNGCVPSSDPATRKFCPKEAVTRSGLAQFLQRGLGRVAYVYTPSGILLNVLKTTYDVSQLNITAGGMETGGTGFIKVDASVSAWNAATSGCPCEVKFWLTDTTTGKSSNYYWVTVLNATGGIYSNQSGAVTWVEPVNTTTTHTFVLRAYQYSGTAGRIDVRGDISAIYAPFGKNGGNTLMVSASQPQGGPDDHPRGSEGN